MTSHLHSIQQRRDLLVARADLQRLALLVQFSSLRKPLRLIDRGIALARRAREHPVLAAAAFVTLAFAFRRRLGRVLRYGLTAWRVYRMVQRNR